MKFMMLHWSDDWNSPPSLYSYTLLSSFPETSVCETGQSRLLFVSDLAFVVSINLKSQVELIMCSSKLELQENMTVVPGSSTFSHCCENTLGIIYGEPQTCWVKFSHSSTDQDRSVDQHHLFNPEKNNTHICNKHYYLYIMHHVFIKINK